MTDVSQSVSLPQESAALAGAVQSLVLAIVAAKKGGATGLALVTASVGAAVADLEPALANVGAFSSELASEPIGVAEAFSVAGFGVARALTGK